MTSDECFENELDAEFIEQTLNSELCQTSKDVVKLRKNASIYTIYTHL